jgi:hypothetical protein
MDALALAPSERAFLEALNRLGVRYLVVGMSAALLQGARGVTEGVDLWFERRDDPRIGEAARAAGGFWVSGAFGMRPPGLGGAGLDDRFDVVLTASGLHDFATEYRGVREVVADGVTLPLLPLHRILVNKRAANRAKDQAQLPAIAAALAVEQDQRTEG